MPKLGMAMTEGIVAKWNKNDGDWVEKDEEIAVVMTKKITYKITAPEAGVLRIIVKEKETRPVNAVLAYITEPGEAIPEVEDVVPVAPVETVTAATVKPEPSVSQPTKPGFVLASPAARRLAKEKDIDMAHVKGTGTDGMVTEGDITRFLEELTSGAEALATSTARKLARQLGLKLSEIPGTGIGGRITEQDVMAFEDQAKAPAAAVPTEAIEPAARIIPFAGMRQAIADHMVESLHKMAQLTMMMEVDVTELVNLRKQVKADFDVTYTDFLVMAVAGTLKRHPIMNATLIGNEIHQLESIHIGVAVALQDGLIVPVVRDTDTMTIREIAQEIRRLAEGARDGTLSVDEVTGGTFTITNLGNYGIDGFTPIINSPESAILGVGRITERVVIHDDQIARRKMTVLSLTIDHRLIDGATGAEFMQSLKELLENPYRLLV
jgi:pyruvate dehydrogenase E2 component (dihydrolipoamide acetyltransferase)